ncbi:immunoglobulin-like domain-containing protein [Enterococcus hirae]
MKSTKKQLKHRIKTSKKGLALAATALILSGSPLSVMQAFAEETPQIASPTPVQDNSSKATTQKEATTNTTQGTQIDQSIYGNLLENPTLSYDAQTNTISGWKVTTQYYVWNSPILNVTFNTLSENGNIVNISGAPGAYFKYNDNQLMINTTNQNPVCLISNSIRALAGRTYEATVTTLPGGTYYDYVGIRENGGVSSTSAPGWHSNPGKISQTKKVSSNVELQMEFETSNGYHSIYDRNSIFFGLKYADQWKAVDGLFTSLDHSTLAPGVSTPQINQVKTLVTNTPNNADQNEMLEEISKAENLVTTQSTTQKQNLLNQIHSLAPNGQLASGVTQTQIDQIQQTIDSDQLLSDADKTEVQNELNNVQKLLNEKIKQEILQEINALKNGDQLAESVDQGKIDILTKKITGSHLSETDKKELKDALQIVQNLLNKQTEQATLEHTIKEQLNNFLSGKEQVTDETVKVVQNNINNLTNVDTKQNYQSQLNKIQAAVKAVNDLFNGKQLADGVDDGKIRAADKLVFEISNGTLKTNLYEKINQAQGLLDQVQITNIQTYMQDDTQKITGTYKGKDVKGVRLVVNNDMKPAVGLEDNGTFSYYFPGLKITDHATLQLLNSKWEVAAEIPVPIERAPLATITEIDPYVQGQSSWIRGKYSGTSASYVGLMVDNELKVKVPFDGLAQNKFQYYMDGLTTKQQAQIILYDANNDEIARKEVPIVEPKNVEITSLKPYTINQSEFIEGTFTGNEAYYVGLVINDNKVVQAYPSENLAKGVIKYYYPNVSKGEKVQVALYDKQMNRVALSDPITINH